MDHISWQTIFVRAGVVLALVAANAFFVAAEFSLVTVRRTRIEAAALAGDRKARLVLTALGDVYRQLSAAQLGITVASILLGYVAEETIAELLRQWVQGLPPVLGVLGRATVASAIAVCVVSFLHVVIGEQAPKAWAISCPEAASRWVTPPLMFFAWITAPATNLLNRSANLVVRLLGFRRAHEGDRVHSPQEILMLLRRSQKQGALDAQDLRFIEGVFRFGEKTARGVMTPRTDIVGFPSDLSLQEARRRVAEVRRSRYPVYRESLDDIVGIVHAKDILAQLEDAASRQVGAVMHDQPLVVPEMLPVDDLLTTMQRRRSHMAVVIDEYGGTSGLVTMEDILEEIVGSIYDEHDGVLDPVDRLGEKVFPGDTGIDDANTAYGFGLEGSAYTTVGGYVFGVLGRLPRVGDRVPVKGGMLEVATMRGTRVHALRFVPSGPHDAAQQPDRPTKATDQRPT